MTPRLAYSLTEAAQALGVSVRSVRYLMQQGTLGFAKLGRRRVIPVSELEKLLRQATVKATARLDADESIRPRTPHNSNGPVPASSEPSSNRGVVTHAIDDGDKFYDTSSTSR